MDFLPCFRLTFGLPRSKPFVFKCGVDYVTTVVRHPIRNFDVCHTRFHRVLTGSLQQMLVGSERSLTFEDSSLVNSRLHVRNGEQFVEHSYRDIHPADLVCSNSNCYRGIDVSLGRYISLNWKGRSKLDCIEDFVKDRRCRNLVVTAANLPATTPHSYLARLSIAHDGLSTSCSSKVTALDQLEWIASNQDGPFSLSI